MQEKIILASQSPRRSQLLEWAEVPFEVVVRPTEETYPEGLDKTEIAIHIARQKGLAVQREDDFSSRIVLSADTIVVLGDRIIGTQGRYEGAQVVEVGGLTLVPGFIDTHLHIESSLVTPHEFERCVGPRGVTTAICDPHEIANVAGPRASPGSCARPRRW